MGKNLKNMSFDQEDEIRIENEDTEEDGSSNNTPKVVDSELYGFLHVSVHASQEEITAAYKKLSRLYHPDKHRDEEKKKHAEAMFAKLQNAYAVLGDPHRRALYDCLGKDGIASDVTALIPRTKTPKEIREEYERLAKEREERMMQQRINPTSRLTMRVNATDLFERYMYDELYDDVIEPSLPTLEITEISFAQTIEAPLTLTDKFVIAGNVSTHNGKGS